MNVVLMEVANQLERLELDLDLSWVPREQNEESDRLSKGNFDGFSEELRQDVKLEELDLPVIAKLMEVAQGLDEEIVLRKTSKEAKAIGGKTKAQDKMRLTQPWWFWSGAEWIREHSRKKQLGRAATQKDM